MICTWVKQKGQSYSWSKVHKQCKQRESFRHYFGPSWNRTAHQRQFGQNHQFMGFTPVAWSLKYILLVWLKCGSLLENRLPQLPQSMLKHLLTMIVDFFCADFGSLAPDLDTEATCPAVDILISLLLGLLKKSSKALSWPSSNCTTNKRGRGTSNLQVLAN